MGSKINLPEMNTIDDIYLDGRREKWSDYYHNDSGIPRVSNILDETINKSYLINWALSFDSKKDYYQTKELTLNIGTAVHLMIDDFLEHKNPSIPDFIIDYDSTKQVTTAYTNFVNWYNNMINNGYMIDILDLERKLTCPWYGGTTDCIMRISNPSYNFSTKYIVDFKTSKSISSDYLLQTYLYLWAYNLYTEEGRLDPITGIGIIRVDKKSSIYQGYFLSYNDPNHVPILDKIGLDAMAMVNWYYRKIDTDNQLSFGRKFQGEIL